MQRTNRIIEVGADGSGFIQEFGSMSESVDQLNTRLEDMNEHMGTMNTTLKEMVGNLKEMTEQMNRSGGGSSRGGFVGGFGRGAAGMGMGAATGIGVGVGLQAFTSISNAIGAVFSEGRARSTELRRTRAALGDSASATELENLGLTESQGNAFIRRTAQVRGRSDVDSIMNQLRAERSFGLDMGSLSNFNRFTRMGGQDVDQSMKMLLQRAVKSNLWDIKINSDGKIEGMAGMQEAMEQMYQLTDAQTSIFERVSNEDSARVMGTFADVGGAFANDPRAASRMMSVHQGITNPNNNFIDAMIKTALAAANPTMTMPELMLKQRQGIFGEGNLSTVMNFMNERYSGDNRLYALMKMFPDLDQGSLVRMSNINDWSKMGSSDEEINKFMENRGVKDFNFKKGAANATGLVEQTEAILLNMTGEVGEEIIKTVDPFIKGMLGTIREIISSDSNDKFSDSVSRFEEAVSKFTTEADDPNKGWYDELPADHWFKKIMGGTPEDDAIREKMFGTPKSMGDQLNAASGMGLGAGLLNLFFGESSKTMNDAANNLNNAANRLDQSIKSNNPNEGGEQ